MNVTMPAPPRLSRPPVLGRAHAVVFPALMIAAVGRAFWQDRLLGVIVLLAAAPVTIILAAGNLSYFRGLLDEVRDRGDHLSCRKGRMHQNVPLRDITRITVDTSFGARIRVECDTAGPLGARLTFLPRSRLSVDIAAMVGDLQARVTEARRMRVGDPHTQADASSEVQDSD